MEKLLGNQDMITENKTPLEKNNNSTDSLNVNINLKVIDENFRLKLKNFYEDDVKKLEKFLESKFPWNSFSDRTF